MLDSKVPLILVVDDDSGIRAVLRLLMERDGYRVFEATTGVEAVSMFDQEHPDVVLMDIRMPLMDGPTACAQIQKLPDGSRTPVLMITALDDRESIDRCFEAGATDYITKPINNAVLRQRVRRLLRTRQAEDALRASEARLSSIIAISADAIILIDVAGHIRLFNPSAERIFGYTADEVIGSPIRRLMPESFAALGTGYFNALAEQWASDWPMGEYREVTARRRDGTDFPVEVSLGKIEEQQQTAFTVTLRDITRRKQAEAEIARRVQELAALSQMGQAATTRLDLDGILSTVIDAVMARLQAEGVSVLLLENEHELVFAAVNGASAEKLRGQHMPVAGLAGEAIQSGVIQRLRSPKDEPRVYRDIEQVSEYHAQDIVAVPLKRGTDVLGVMEAVHHEAGVFTNDDVHLLEAAASWAAIAISNARLYASEHTQRQLAEALRDTAATLTGTLDLDEVLDRILDNASRVVPHDSATVMLVESGVARTAACRGYADHEVTERVMARRFSVADTTHLRLMAEERQPLVIADTHQFVDWMMLPQAAVVRSFVGAPIRFKRKLLGFLCLESKTPAFFGPEYADRLQIFANQASIAIENARLYQNEQDQFAHWQQSQAVIMQTEKLGALGRLAASLVQEINQPLDVINQHLNRTIEAVQNVPAVIHELTAAQRQIERLHQTARNVLNFARPDTETPIMTPIDTVVQRAIEQVAPRARQAQIEISTDLEPTPPLSLAVEQMTQAILNVLLNSLEAVGKHGQIHLVTRIENERVMLMIVDDGPAIKPDVLSHIFEPFYSTKSGSTGLGLTISHNIVQQHGGTLHIENLTNDRGVVVTLRLPVHAPVAIPAALNPYHVV